MKNYYTLLIKNGIFFLVFFASFSVHAQTEWQWATRGGSGSGSSSEREDERVRDIAIDKEGNSYVISYINVSNPDIAGNPVTVYSDAYYNDIALAAFDCFGNYQWSKIIGSFSDDWVQGVEVDTLGHVYIAGKVDPAYQSASTKPINFSTDTIIPYSSNDTEYKKTIFLAQYDTQGNFQWLRMPQEDGISHIDGRNILSLDLSVSQTGEAYWLVQIGPGAYADGIFVNTNPGWSMYIFHYDINGVFVEAIPLDYKLEPNNTSHFDWERDPISGWFYICGWYNYSDDDEVAPILGGNPVTHSMYAGAFDAQGNFLWMRENTDTYNIDSELAWGELTSMILDKQGNIYLTGVSMDGDFFAGGEVVSEPAPPPLSDFYFPVPLVAKLDPTGNLLWINNAAFGLGAAGQDITVNGKEVAITGLYSAVKWGDVDIDTPTNSGGRAYLIHLDKNSGGFIRLDSIANIQNSSITGTALAAGQRRGYYVGGKFEYGLVAGNVPPVLSNGGPSDFFVAKFGENNCGCELPEADFSYQSNGEANGAAFAFQGTGIYDSVEWGFGDGTISTLANPEHTYATQGVYRVCVTVYDSCGHDTYCQMVDTENLGIDGFADNSLQVYPNPAGEQVFVSTRETLRFGLYDLSGRKVLAGTLEAGETAVSLTGLPTGLYLLRAENENGQVKVVKVVKEL